LSRESVFICNVLKCRPPENRNPLPNEIEQCSPYLLRQLEAIKPRIICCLGKFAAELLLGVKGTIASMRGRVYTYRGSKMIVTYHPAACLRNPNYKRPVWEDMQLLAREYLADSRKPIPPGTVVRGRIHDRNASRPPRPVAPGPDAAPGDRRRARGA